MRNFKKILQPLSLLLLAAFILSSCSQKTVSISSSSKLLHAQAMQKSNQQVLAIEKTIGTTPENQVATIETKPSTVEPSLVSPTKLKPLAQVGKTIKSKFMVANQDVKHLVATTTSSINNTGKNHATASYKESTHTQGLIGLAIVLIVIGLVFAIIGFGGLGSLFVTIGIIVLVVGLVFLLFHLLGAAASY